MVSSASRFGGLGQFSAACPVENARGQIVAGASVSHRRRHPGKTQHSPRRLQGIFQRAIVAQPFDVQALGFEEPGSSRAVLDQPAHGRSRLRPVWREAEIGQHVFQLNRHPSDSFVGGVLDMVAQ